MALLDATSPASRAAAPRTPAPESPSFAKIQYELAKNALDLASRAPMTPDGAKARRIAETYVKTAELALALAEKGVPSADAVAKSLTPESQDRLLALARLRTSPKTVQAIRDQLRPQLAKLDLATQADLERAKLLGASKTLLNRVVELLLLRRDPTNELEQVRRLVQQLEVLGVRLLTKTPVAVNSVAQPSPFAAEAITQALAELTERESRVTASLSKREWQVTKALQDLELNR